MAIVSTKIIHRAVWGGQGEAMPDGMWYGEVTAAVVTASGDTTLRLLFQTSDAPQLDSRLYSLEQLTIVRTLGTTTNGMLRTLNMGINPTLQGTSEGVLDQFWQVRIVADASGLFTAMEPQNARGLSGLFLGGQINRATDTGLRVTIDETVDNSSTQFNAMGYFWGARARSILGGPLRPVGGLFQR